MKTIHKKVALLGLSCLLLIGVTVYITMAWYTRMVSTAGMEFEVAQWDFTANQMIDDFTVNIYQYSHVLQENGVTQVAAPGTAGYIPITLSLGDSQVDIQYYITVDTSTMSEEFQDRIFFYYTEEVDEDDTSSSTSKELIAFEGLGEDMTGIITLDEKTKLVYVYWEWIYEVEPSEEAVLAYLVESDAIETDATVDGVDSDRYNAAERTLIDQADAFDTLVGKNPDDYASDMIATLQIYGVQKEPDSTDDTNVFED